MKKIQKIIQKGITNTWKTNPWKIIAIMSMAVFAIIIICLAMQVYQFRSSFRPMTPEEVSLAGEIVSRALEQRGENIEGYEVDIRENVRRPGRRGYRHAGNSGTPGKSVVQVSLEKEGVREIFLIDIDTKQIVLNSKTGMYDWMRDVTEPNSRPAHQKRKQRLP